MMQLKPWQPLHYIRQNIHGLFHLAKSLFEKSVYNVHRVCGKKILLEIDISESPPTRCAN